MVKGDPRSEVTDREPFLKTFANRGGLAANFLLSASKKAIRINEADVAELVDARDLKSLDGNIVWVRFPPPAPAFDREAREGCCAEALGEGGPRGGELRLDKPLAQAGHPWRHAGDRLGKA